MTDDVIVFYECWTKGTQGAILVELVHSWVTLDVPALPALLVQWHVSDHSAWSRQPPPTLTYGHSLANLPPMTQDHLDLVYQFVGGASGSVAGHFALPS